MKLLYSTTSPYARKVRIVAIEKGLAPRIELVPATPWPDPAPVAVHNPLGRIPVLLLTDGSALYDSPVICEYLDTLIPASALIPREGAARWTVLRQQALADGILDAAVSVVLERRRPATERSPAAEQRALAALRRSVLALATEVRADGPFDLGQIACAVAIGYLHFRLGDAGLGLDAPALAAYWRAVKARPSLAATEPA
jgi:glutathione S-transferase